MFFLNPLFCKCDGVFIHGCININISAYVQLIKYHVSSQKTYTFKCIKKLYFYIMHKLFAIIIQWHAHVNTARVAFVNINGGPKK